MGTPTICLADNCESFILLSCYCKRDSVSWFLLLLILDVRHSPGNPDVFIYCLCGMGTPKKSAEIIFSQHFWEVVLVLFGKQK